MFIATFRRVFALASYFVAVQWTWALPTLYHVTDLGAYSQAVHIDEYGEAAAWLPAWMVQVPQDALYG
jgi:hypothetical protein